MLIYRCCRLRAAVALCAVEIEGGDAMRAEGAFERGAAVRRLGCVISHSFIVVLLPVAVLGNRCATLEQKTLSIEVRQRDRTIIVSSIPRIKRG
jgi:hypothetical protein